MTQHFDLCIIGTGSGNSILDDRFDDWSVAIVERGVFGGTCLNVGCIPSKMLIYPADIVESARHAARLGVDATVDAVRWADIRDRTFGRIDPIAAGGRQYRIGLPNVTVFEHDARFVGPKTLQVGDEQITADRFVIAAGARTHAPPIPGLDLVPYDTSDTIMRIDEVPERLTILGAGFIATELGHVFDAFGSAVTMIVRGDVLLRHEDEEISRRITDRLAERFELVRSATPRSVAMDGDTYVIEVDTPDGLKVIEADRLLVATGRVPNGGQLNVEAAGVRLDPMGYVITDEHLATGVEGIWALGDVRNPLQLKHLANLEARVVQHNLLHPEAPRSIDERYVPHAVFTNPQIGSVGLTEYQAEMHGRPYAVAVKEYAGTAYGWAMEDTTSCAKVIADVETRRLIGAHIIGPQASILIQQLVQGMRFGQTVDEMARDVIYPHPALSEVVENALLDLADALDRAALGATPGAH
ncbi:MAG: mycothione reductase [Acidimicrobiales bacterium]